jgi:hypothetical protein
VTVPQFHFQGIGVEVPSQFLTMPPIATIGAGADLAATRRGSASKPVSWKTFIRLIIRLAETPTPEGTSMTNEETFDVEAGAFALVMLCGCSRPRPTSPRCHRRRRPRLPSPNR